MQKQVKLLNNSTVVIVTAGGAEVTAYSGTNNITTNQREVVVISDGNPSVDDNTSILFFTMQSEDGSPQDAHVIANLFNTTHIEFNRPAANANPVNITTYVAEFSSGVRVYRGRNISDNPEFFVEIGGTVNTSSSFMVNSGINMSGGIYNTDDFIRVTLRNSTHISLFNTQGSPIALEFVEWQVVEFNGSTVQRDNNLMSSTSNDIRINISSFDLSRSFLLASYHSSADSGGGPSEEATLSRIVNSTQIGFTRAVGDGSNALNISWEVIELQWR